MIIPYSKLRSAEAGLPPVYMALLVVRIISPKGSVRVNGVVDSGAALTLLNSIYGTKLGIQWDSGIETRIVGIDGIEHPAYVHDLELEIINLKNSRRKSKIAFIDLPRVDALLGQTGFFEHYVLRFKHRAKMFDVDIE